MPSQAVGSSESFPDNVVRVVRILGERVGVVRLDGQLYAFEDRCTHDDGPLCDGPLIGCELECPRHGARFDVRDGHVTRAPAMIGLECYEVEEKDGQVHVTLPD